MLLAGDIGGTKTYLSIFNSQDGPCAPVAEATFPSGEYPDLKTMVGDFLDETKLSIKSASFGVAGPVVGKQASITNIPWEINTDQLQKDLGVSAVHLLNDLEAIAYAVPFLQPEDTHILNVGSPLSTGNIAVVAPGTGLGEAFLTWNGSHYQAHASEGGHTDFAPTNPLQVDLLTYFQRKFGHISYEKICSGIGIPNIYQFLKESKYAQEPAWLAEELSQVDDPTPTIVRAALRDHPPEICAITLTTFVAILGAEAGNLALTVLATGGVYLGGGIPPRILSTLKKRDFLESFTNKGRFSDLVTKFPVHVILNPKAALLGAAYYGLERTEH